MNKANNRVVTMSFPKRFLTSIKDIDKYKYFTEMKLGRGFLYFLVLMIIFSLILSFASSYKMEITKSFIADNISTLPEFTIKDGVFHMESENPITIEDNTVLRTIYLVVFGDSLQNTNGISYKSMVYLSNEAYNEEGAELTNNAGLYLGLYSDRIIFKNDYLVPYANIALVGSSDANTTISLNKFEKTYNELYDQAGMVKDLSKAQIAESVRNISVYSLLPSLIFGNLVKYFVSNLISILAFALLGYVLNKILKTELKYGQLLNISFSAITLPVVLQIIYEVVRLFTGFEITYFLMLFSIISYIYIAAALYFIKSENNREIKNANRILTDEEEKEEVKKEKELEEKDKQEKEDVKKKDDEILKKQKRKRKEKNNEENTPQPQANIKEV